MRDTIQVQSNQLPPPVYLPPVHIPNTDGLKPGTTVPIVQWDHDMAFFVPMGLGTVSEDGSALVSNPDSGITKAGWGGVPPPIADNDAECENGMNKSTGQSCGTCDVTIKADNEENELWKLFDKGGTEVSFVAKLSTGCGKATVEWNFEGSLIEAPLITIYEYSDFGTYNVEVKIFCDNCHPSVSDKIKIEIFLPVVEIKKDEEMPFELIDRGAGVISYFERTNLIVEVQYPTDHPDAKEVIIDFTGTVKMLENENTNYYNDAVFNTFLPFDIAIMNGKGEKSLDSDSTVKNIGDAVPELAEIYLEAIDFDFVESESVLTIDVEQWVKNSGLSISENVGELNNSEMPDWLEKAVWTIVRNARAQSGIVAEVGQGVTSVKLLANNTQRICGEVPFLEENEIKIVSVCAGNLKLLRENSSKYLNKLVLHETRHTWQNHQLLSKPTTAMGEGPVNDSDKDGCPEIVPIGSEAELGDITPIQDGAGTTGGDNGPVIGQQTKECYDLFEFDGKGFGNDHF